MEKIIIKCLKNTQVPRVSHPDLSTFRTNDADVFLSFQKIEHSIKSCCELFRHKPHHKNDSEPSLVQLVGQFVTIS